MLNGIGRGHLGLNTCMHDVAERTTSSTVVCCVNCRFWRSSKVRWKVDRLADDIRESTGAHAMLVPTKIIFSGVRGNEHLPLAGIWDLL